MANDNNRSVPSRSRRRLLSLVGTGSVIALAGCSGGDDNGDSGDDGSGDSTGDGGSGDDGSGDSTGDGGSGDDGSGDSTGDDGSNGGPPTGGTLEVASAGDPENLDPHTTTINVAQLALENVMEGLFDINAELEVEPLLASDYQVSDDNLEYTIQLKEGVQFHEPIGGEMTAEDVEYTINRILDPDLGSPRAANFQLVDEIEPLGDYEIRFTLSEPFAPFLIAFTEGAYIVPANAEEEVDLQQTPVGTGPFSFESYSVNESLELTQFGDYHQDGMPLLDSVMFNVVPEAATRSTRLNTGEAHVMYGVPFQNANNIDSGSDTRIESVPALWKQGFWFNSNAEPLGDRRVRQAINYAINREQFIQGVLFGRGEVVDSPVPPTSAWSDLIDSGEPVQQDLAQAEQLLADAGYSPSDISLTIKASRTPGPTYADTATLISSQLSQLGIDMNIDIMDFSTWLDEVWVANDYELSVGSWSGRIDPDGWYYRQYHSEGAWNHWGYANDEVDRLVEEGRTTIGTEDRAEIYSQIESIVSEDLPMTYLYFREDLTGLRNEVGGYEITPVEQASFHETYIEN